MVRGYSLLTSLTLVQFPSDSGQAETVPVVWLGVLHTCVFLFFPEEPLFLVVGACSTGRVCELQSLVRSLPKTQQKGLLSERISAWDSPLNFV